MIQEQLACPPFLGPPLTTRLLPWPTLLQLDAVNLDETTITCTLATLHETADCPQCAQPSHAKHSRYVRSVADLPWAGMKIRLAIHARKFFCRTPACPQRIFAERLPTIVAPRARRTQRLGLEQRQLALEQSAEAAARTARRQGMPVSPRTLLRLVRAYPTGTASTPRVLGVDDFAFRKGHVYGTILVDIERHKPIDILPERTASVLADWLAEHPGVEIITRDRATEYAEGARRGAPTAVQVADRFHILQNVREMVQRLLEPHQAALQAAARAALDVVAPTPSLAPPDIVPITPPPPAMLSHASPPTQNCSSARRARRLAQYTTIQVLRERGESIHAIADQMGIARQTVRRFVSADQFPERATRRPRPSKLDPHVACLEAQLRAGEMNGTRLWRLIRDTEGYRGSRALVSRWVTQHRHLLPAQMQVLPPPRGRGRQAAWPVIPPSPRVLSARQAAWLFIRRLEDLEADDRAVVEHLLKASPSLGMAHELVQAFIQLVRTRAAAKFDGWLAQAASSGVGELERFASALVRDYDAVFAALSLPYSNGPVEGHVNRLKCIKRMGYGRAKLDLLRERVLA